VCGIRRVAGHPNINPATLGRKDRAIHQRNHCCSVGAFSTAAGPHPVWRRLSYSRLHLSRLSVNVKFVRFVSLGAKKSSLNLELPPAGILEGENDFNPVRSVPLMVTVPFAEVRLPTP
jgi:hypothetical protein